MSDIKELAQLKGNDLQKLHPLIGSKEAYDAFLLWLSHKESKAYMRLLGKPIAEELIRIAERLQFIEELKNTRFEVLEMGKNYGSNKR